MAKGKNAERQIQLWGKAINFDFLNTNLLKNTAVPSTLTTARFGLKKSLISLPMRNEFSPKFVATRKIQKSFASLAKKGPAKSSTCSERWLIRRG